MHTHDTREVYVAGTGMTAFGRYAAYSAAQLARRATVAALGDAGLRPSGVQAVFFSSATLGAGVNRSAPRAPRVLAPLGFDGIPMIDVDDRWAGGAIAFHLAAMQVASGQVDVALAVGAESLSTARADLDPQDLLECHDLDAIRAYLRRFALPRQDRSLAVAGAGSGWPSVFRVHAANARLHMVEHGTTLRHLALVASKNHLHSTFNDLSYLQHPLSADEVLAAKVVASPITLPMCAPACDGAAAVVVCSAATGKRLGPGRAVRVLACSMRGGRMRPSGEQRRSPVRLAADCAYEQAGVDPRDVSTAEVLDLSAFSELVQTEELRLVPAGAGGHAAARGDTKIGGRIPVNTSGGLESRGHAVSATGLAQIHELVLQLRRRAGRRQVENARLGLASTGGDVLGGGSGLACVTLLGGA